MDFKISSGLDETFHEKKKNSEVVQKNTKKLHKRIAKIKSTEKLHKKNNNIQFLFRADNNQCSPSDICTAPHVMQGWDGIDLLVRFSNQLASALSEVFYLPHSLFTDQVGNLFTCFWLWACLCLKGHEGRTLMRPMIIDNPIIL